MKQEQEMEVPRHITAWTAYLRAAKILISILVLPSVSHAGYAGVGGCYPDFESAKNSICINNNPDVTTNPPYAYYRDLCQTTAVPYFTVYAHMINTVNGTRSDFSYQGGPITSCDVVPQTVVVSGTQRAEGCDSCKALKYGNPIYPLTASKKEIIPTSLRVGGLELTLTYDSRRIATALAASVNVKDIGDPPSFGPMWISNFHRRLLISQLGMNRRLFRGDGTIVNFQYTNGTYVSDRSANDQLIDQTLGYLYVDATSMTVESYNANGQLLRSADSLGNVLYFSYSTSPSIAAPAAGYLLQVADGNGRQINFEYTLPAGGVEATDGRVSKIWTSESRIITPAYDGNGNLSSLTWEDGSVRQFLYESVALPWALTGILDENGSRYSTFRYDFAGRVVSTEHAGGVERYAVDYPSAPSVVVRDVLDIASGTTYRINEWQAPENIGLLSPNGQFVSIKAATILGLPVYTGVSQPAGSGSVEAKREQQFDARGNFVYRDDFSGYRTCFIYDERDREVVRVDGLPTTANCSSITSDYANQVNDARRKSSIWHPDWNVRIREIEPKAALTMVYHGQPDPFSNGAIANCTPASAMPHGKALPLLCKQVEQALKTPADPFSPQDTYAPLVALLLHFEGTNNSTTIQDAGYSERAVTAVGSAKISTGQAKFGGGSLRLGGSGAYVSIPDDPVFRFGGNDFTVEAWINPATALGATTGQTVFASKWNGASDASWLLDYYMGSVRGVIRNGSTSIVTQGAAQIPGGAWTHIAFSRAGSNFYVFVNGSVVASGSSTALVNPSTTPVLLGYKADGSGTEFFNGYMDDVRVTSGRARYTASFVPPPAAYPDANIIDSTISARRATFSYDAAGRMLASVDANSKVTAYAYYSATSFAGVVPSQIGHTVGDLQSITNAAGQVTQFTQYDRAGRVRQMIDPKGVVTDITYTPRGWVSTVTATAPGGSARVTSYSYDGVGQLTGVTQPDGSTLSYSYDEAHRLVSVTDAKGNSVNYTLDNVGNRIAEDIKDPSGVLQRSIGRSFDALNRLQQITGAAQ